MSLHEIFRFALPLGSTDAVSMLNGRLDRYLILLFFPAVAFAEYQAGAWQIPFITTIPYAVGTAFAPRFVELYKAAKPEEAVAIWRETVTKVSLLVIPATMVFVVGAEEVVELLFTRDYLAGAPVFRLYAILTLGRVAAFGTVIVAAGRPGFLFQAAVLSLLSNLLLSVPLVFVLGFIGPAVGTVLAFLPTVVFYCWCIGRASGMPLKSVFPLAAYLRVLVVACVAGSVAVALKLGVDAPAGWMLAGEAILVLGGFAVVGTLSGVIERGDWTFAWHWLRLGMLRGVDT